MHARGLSLGTARALVGGPCAELVGAHSTMWAMPSVRMHTVAGVLGCAEEALAERATHAGRPNRQRAVMAQLAATEPASGGASASGRGGTRGTSESACYGSSSSSGGGSGGSGGSSSSSGGGSSSSTVGRRAGRRFPPPLARWDVFPPERFPIETQPDLLHRARGL